MPPKSPGPTGTEPNLTTSMPREPHFLAFLEQNGATRITTDLALRWAKLPRDVHPYHWRKRLCVVRLFARYLATIDPQTEIPSKDLLAAMRRRLPPYIYWVRLS